MGINPNGFTWRYLRICTHRIILELCYWLIWWPISIKMAMQDRGEGNAMTKKKGFYHFEEHFFLKHDLVWFSVPGVFSSCITSCYCLFLLQHTHFYAILHCIHIFQVFSLIECIFIRATVDTHSKYIFQNLQAGSVYNIFSLQFVTLFIYFYILANNIFVQVLIQKRQLGLY